LAERIAKCYVQVEQGVLAAGSRRTLREAAAELDALLPAVAANAPDAESAEAFTLLRVLWKELRPWTQRAPTRENARQVAERVDEMSWVAAKGARLLGSEGTAQRAAVNAMRAATLAQRLARLALQRRTLRGSDASSTQVDEAKAGLAAALAALRATSFAADATDEMRMADAQHAFLLQALAEVEAGGAAAAFERLARVADYLTESLERLARLEESAGAV
ncbi:MAG TPA: hypothetical protein VFJ62_06025, partial [Usitatibacter sp.]|nr:hypothetical protein [Usitatibacter sp.]